MATETKKRTGKTSTKKATSKAAKKVRFDNTNSEHWHSIPSKGQLFALAVATFNGAKIDGKAFGSREVAKEQIAAAKEAGLLD